MNECIWVKPWINIEQNLSLIVLLDDTSEFYKQWNKIDKFQ